MSDAEREAIYVYDVEAAQEFLQGFPAWARNRGKTLCANDAVRHLDGEEDGTGFVAKVQANRVYHVTLFYSDEGGWDAKCSCPVEVDCEHAYAAMTAVLTGQR